jgi:hypothetical protein
MKCAWHDRGVLLAGIWLFAAPFALGVPSLTHPPVVAAYVCGAVLVSSAAQAPAVPDLIEEWVGLVAGILLAASPWLLGYNDEPALTWNAVAVGALVAALALVGVVRCALARRSAADDAIQTGS